MVDNSIDPEIQRYILTTLIAFISALALSRLSKSRDEKYAILAAILEDLAQVAGMSAEQLAHKLVLVGELETKINEAERIRKQDVSRLDRLLEDEKEARKQDKKFFETELRKAARWQHAYMNYSAILQRQLIEEARLQPKEFIPPPDSDPSISPENS